MSATSSGIYDLQDQTALVTGGAQGLGLAIVEMLARCGATVWIGDLQEEKGETAAASLKQEGLKVSTVRLDIADSRSVDSAFESVVSQSGRLDILVTSAGVGQAVTPIVELSDDEWNRVLGITLTGTFYCCRAAGRIMTRQESGCIVNLASVNGTNPAVLVAAYNSAKAGVISLTKCLALELASSGIRVNAISPGPVYTDFNRAVMSQRSQRMQITEEQLIERVRGAVPLGRWGEPNDIANGVAFLCSPQAAWITGEVLRVSGGLEGVSAPLPKPKAAAGTG